MTDYACGQYPALVRVGHPHSSVSYQAISYHPKTLLTSSYQFTHITPFMFFSPLSLPSQ